MRYFIILLCSLFCTVVQAKDIPVLTRFDESSAAYQALSFYVRELNTTQNEYNFMIRVFPGALGENADLRSIALGKEGEEHILHSTLTSYTSNPIQFKNSWDREKSFIILKSFWVTVNVLTVNPEEKDIKSFVEKLKKKDIIYLGGLTTGGSRDTLSSVFLKYYNLENKTKLIRYTLGSDMNRAVLNNEIDFAISVPNAEGATKVILTSGKHANRKYPYAPSGKEIGIDDFFNETMSIFSVPSTLPSFAEKMKPVLEKMCSNPKLDEFAEKLASTMTCYDSNYIRKQIAEENEWVKKYLLILDSK